jgi:hypothetical protein
MEVLTSVRLFSAMVMARVVTDSFLAERVRFSDRFVFAPSWRPCRYVPDVDRRVAAAASEELCAARVQGGVGHAGFVGKSQACERIGVQKAQARSTAVLALIAADGLDLAVGRERQRGDVDAEVMLAQQIAVGGVVGSRHLIIAGWIEPLLFVMNSRVTLC